MLSSIALTILATGPASLSASSEADFALRENMEAWTRHPIYGDPSFDTWERAAGNPVHRGAPPYEWPVNGFLFEDPVGGAWYLYAGLYPDGYKLNDSTPMKCIVYRSTDKGASWECTGPIFPDESFTFDGQKFPMFHAPDVSVVYDSGKYHLIYDFVTAGADWTSIYDPKDGTENGIGYAWADKPEGPYHRVSPPVYANSTQPLRHEKYRRGYAQTLIRRANDWMVLAMMDSGPCFGWALFGMTSPSPGGPYGEPVFLKWCEDDTFQPPLMEYFPAFSHGGRVYAPATSVAINRNFQILHSSPIEEAMDPAEWETTQHGSVWHAENVPHERMGIWGQTIACFVDKTGSIHAMFPTQDEKSWGALSIASRPWDKPYRDRGFAMSGHKGASVSFLKRGYETFKLEVEGAFSGSLSLLWAAQPVFGPDKPQADAALHAVSPGPCRWARIADGRWALGERDAQGKETNLAEGSLEGGFPGNLALIQEPGVFALVVDGNEVWRSALEARSGAIGLMLGQTSYAKVEKFAIAGEARPVSMFYMADESILGAAQNQEWWDAKTGDPQFRYGVGRVSNKDGLRAKWNIVGGASVVLHAPKGPEYGAAVLIMDGETRRPLDFNAAAEQSSASMSKPEALPTSRWHTVVLKETAGRVPLDCLEVVYSGTAERE